MQEPVIYHECCAQFVEISVVEGEEVLVLVVQTLDRVRLAFGEVPDVAWLELGDLVVAVGIYGGDCDSASVDEAPFGLREAISSLRPCCAASTSQTYHPVPMNLPNCTFVQMLLRGRNIRGNGKIRYHLLTNPSAVKQPGVRVREPPFEIRYYPIVGTLLPKIVLVVEVDLVVCPT